MVLVFPDKQCNSLSSRFIVTNPSIAPSRNTLVTKSSHTVLHYLSTYLETSLPFSHLAVELSSITLLSRSLWPSREHSGRRERLLSAPIGPWSAHVCKRAQYSRLSTSPYLAPNRETRDHSNYLHSEEEGGEDFAKCSNMRLTLRLTTLKSPMYDPNDPCTQLWSLRTDPRLSSSNPLFYVKFCTYSDFIHALLCQLFLHRLAPKFHWVMMWWSECGGGMGRYSQVVGAHSASAGPTNTLVLCRSSPQRDTRSDWVFWSFHSEYYFLSYSLRGICEKRLSYRWWLGLLNGLNE